MQRYTRTIAYSIRDYGRPRVFVDWAERDSPIFVDTKIGTVPLRGLRPYNRCNRRKSSRRQIRAIMDSWPSAPGRRGIDHKALPITGSGTTGEIEGEAALTAR
jgi:hypothetical protein